MSGLIGVLQMYRAWELFRDKDLVLENPPLAISEFLAFGTTAMRFITLGLAATHQWTTGSQAIEAAQPTLNKLAGAASDTLNSFFREIR
jgi:hypothetical protein